MVLSSLCCVRDRRQVIVTFGDNLANPYRIASIFYMYIDIGEQIVGASVISEGPRLAKNAHLSHCGPYR